MQTATIHRIFNEQGEYLEVQEQDGQVTIRRVYDSSNEGFYVALTTDEFRAIVNLLKPFAEQQESNIQDYPWPQWGMRVS